MHQVCNMVARELQRCCVRPEVKERINGRQGRGLERVLVCVHELDGDECLVYGEDEQQLA